MLTTTKVQRGCNACTVVVSGLTVAGKRRCSGCVEAGGPATAHRATPACASTLKPVAARPLPRPLQPSLSVPMWASSVRVITGQVDNVRAWGA